MHLWKKLSGKICREKKTIKPFKTLNKERDYRIWEEECKRNKFTSLFGDGGRQGGSLCPHRHCWVGTQRLFLAVLWGLWGAMGSPGPLECKAYTPLPSSLSPAPPHGLWKVLFSRKSTLIQQVLVQPTDCLFRKCGLLGRCGPLGPVATHWPSRSLTTCQAISCSIPCIY